MSQSTRKLRWRLQLRAILLLAAVWVLLWGELSLINVLYGLVLGWLVSVVFWLAPIRYYGAIHLGGLARLAALQLWDLATASFQLAVVAFRPKVELRPGVIRVRLRYNSDLYQVATAELISIVPGTLVIDAPRHPRLLYLHVFHLPDHKAIRKQREHALKIEERVVRAFGSEDELRAADLRAAERRRKEAQP